MLGLSARRFLALTRAMQCEELRERFDLACMARAAQTDQKEWKRFCARHRAALSEIQATPTDDAQDEVAAIEAFRAITMAERAKYGGPPEGMK